MSNLQHVNAGQPVKPSAGDYNAFVDAARAHRAGHGRQVNPSTAQDHNAIIYVHNTTASTIARYGILGIDDATFDPATALAGFQGPICIEGVAPVAADHANRFVITLEPIAADAIGKAILAGVVQVLVTVSDDAHTRAIPETANTDNLVSDGAGIEILWRPGGTGSQWCIVRVGPAGVVGDGVWIGDEEWNAGTSEWDKTAGPTVDGELLHLHSDIDDAAHGAEPREETTGNFAVGPLHTFVQGWSAAGAAVYLTGTKPTGSASLQFSRYHDVQDAVDHSRMAIDPSYPTWYIDLGNPTDTYLVLSHASDTTPGVLSAELVGAAADSNYIGLTIGAYDSGGGDYKTRVNLALADYPGMIRTGAGKNLDWFPGLTTNFTTDATHIGVVWSITDNSIAAKVSKADIVAAAGAGVVEEFDWLIKIVDGALATTVITLDATDWRGRMVSLETVHDTFTTDAGAVWTDPGRMGPERVGLAHASSVDVFAITIGRAAHLSIDGSDGGKLKYHIINNYTGADPSWVHLRVTRTAQKAIASPDVTINS